MKISDKVNNLKIKLFKNKVKEVENKIDDKRFLSEIIDDFHKKIDDKKNKSVEVLEDAFLFLYLIKDWISGDYKDFSKKTIIYIVAGIIYFITPMDAIPDVIFKLGFIDDFSIFALIISANKEEVQKYKEYREKNKNKDDSEKMVT